MINTFTVQLSGGEATIYNYRQYSAGLLICKVPQEDNSKLFSFTLPIPVPNCSNYFNQLIQLILTAIL